jgi:hypothetical protein
MTKAQEIRDFIEANPTVTKIVDIAKACNTTPPQVYAARKLLQKKQEAAAAQMKVHDTLRNVILDSAEKIDTLNGVVALQTEEIAKLKQYITYLERIHDSVLLLEGMTNRIKAMVSRDAATV